jgi:hypothetical protein
VSPQEPPPLPAHLAADAGWSQIREVARWQRYLNLLALGLVLAFGLVTVAPLPAVLVQLALAPLEIWLLFRLAGALNLSQPKLWAAGGLVPFVNFVVILILSQMATGRLRAAGLHVGLLGASNVPELRPPARGRTERYRRLP